MQKTNEKRNGFPLGYLLFAFTFIAIGVSFIIFTSQAIDVMCYLIGGIMILAAIVNAVLALAEKKRGAAFYVKIILCIFAIVSGVVVMISKEVALEYIVGAAALLLIIDASFKLQTAIKAKSLKTPLWWALVIIVVVCYVCAACLIKFYTVQASQLMVGLLGGVLVMDGALNLLTPVYLSVIARKEKEELKKEEVTEGESEKEN